MRTVNITLQGKGGVGKSFVASLLSQHHQQKGRSVVCIDTDPVNNTLAGYAAFGARRLRIADGSKVSERNFDQMMEWILGEDADFVIDNGASCFLPLSNYLVENGAVPMIVEAGKAVVVHTVITGGQALIDTLHGLDQLARQMPEPAKIVVWLNEYFGDIEKDGKSFEEMAVYQAHQHRVAGVVRLPRQNPDTFGKDLEAMLDRKLTFGEVKASAEFSLMAKQRLTMIGRSIFQQMDLVV